MIRIRENRVKRLNDEIKDLRRTNILLGDIIRELIDRIPKEKISKKLIKYSGKRGNTK